jgi:hypothetical protein
MTKVIKAAGRRMAIFLINFTPCLCRRR